MVGSVSGRYREPGDAIHNTGDTQVRRRRRIIAGDRSGFFVSPDFLQSHSSVEFVCQRKYRKYPCIMRTFSTKILTSALYVGIFIYICGYVEKCYICGLKVGVCIICGCTLYVGIYGIEIDVSLSEK